MSTHENGLDQARAVADAVLYEGYLLYPYRASSGKNRVRWQFGVLGPRGDGDGAESEGPTMATDLLVHDQGDGTVGVRARFLQLQARTVERATGPGTFEAAHTLECDGRTWISWDEAVDHEIDLGTFDLAALRSGAHTGDIEVPAGTETEPLRDGYGTPLGRLVRRRWPLHLSARIELTGNGGPVQTLRVTLANRRSARAEEPPTEADHHHDARSRTLRRSALSAHLTLRARNAAFMSVIDPPPWAEEPARACRSHRLWPVLVGDTGTDDVVLAAPIILYDRPTTAERSRGDLFDSTEIDEILSLRVMTLTDQEKHEARATDARAAEIVDRCDALTAGDLERMHGLTEEVRPVPGPRTEAGADDVPVWATPAEQEGPAGQERPWWDPGADASVDPATDTVQVAGVPLGRGSTVRLRPGPGADAQDLFFAGRVATVAGVHHDVDGGIHLAVLLSDDPASELHQWYGRYLYFGTDEVEPCPAAEEGGRP